MTRGWMHSLLRARQVQEDVARERLAHARRHADDARTRVRAEDDRVEAMLAQTSPQTAQAFIASVSARQAAAATLAAARHAQAFAEDQVDARTAGVVQAARGRRGAEKLVERDAAATKARADASVQRELDDVAVRRRTGTDGAPR